MDKKEYKSLKFFVYFMGIMLVIGMLVIVMSIYKLATKQIKDCSLQSYELANLALPAEIKSIAVEGGNYVLLLNSVKGKQKALIINKCNGQMVNEINFNIPPKYSK